LAVAVLVVQANRLEVVSESIQYSAVLHLLVAAAVDHLLRLAVTEDQAAVAQELLQMSLEEAQAHLDKVTLVVLDQITAVATMAQAQAVVALLQ
jgi:C4-type Zn-finger protein